jgi:competence protein ComEA
VLPLPRRRLDTEQVRERLRRLAGLDPEPGGAGHDVDGAVPRTVDLAPVVVGRASLRAVGVALAVAAFATWLVVHLTTGGAPSPLQLVPGTPIASSAGASPGAATTTRAASPSTSVEHVVVQVVGAVVHPGLVTLAADARVADAIAAAGGLVHRGASGGLNLARTVVDGEQVVVSPSTPVEGGASGAVRPGTATPSAGVVDLNRATVADLDGLPGVGPVTAARILDWRAAHGRFASVDQLREVSGIGARTLERLRPHVRV